MIQPVDRNLMPAIQDKLDNLNKPKGSLGRLETLAMQVALIQHSLHPRLIRPCHLLFGGDHGIEREGVSASPREVTRQQMRNYCLGGGGVNVLCRQHGFQLRVVDVGVDYIGDSADDIRFVSRKIGFGTRNFRYEAAMSRQEWAQALQVGAEQVDACRAEGCNVIGIGEMGVGNTSPSSILMHLFTAIPLVKCVGAGSGLGDAGIRHKLSVLEDSLARFEALKRDHAGDYTGVTDTIRHFAGFEMAAAIGAMLHAAEEKMIVLVDGFIMTACMLAASQMDAAVKDYAVFGHQGDEGGHKLMLDAMGAEPLLHLDMRLGEGTGALCAYPIVVSAVKMFNEMDNFSHANITKYF